VHLLFAVALTLSQLQRNKIDAIVEQVMHVRHIAGLSVGVARKGERLYLRGYGLRDVGRSLPADGYTIYSVGSIAKQFTAALVLQEVAGGRIALDSPVRHYLSTIGTDAGIVTTAQLLNQTSGISSQSNAAGAELSFTPGSAWLYSNANYALLGMILQKISGAQFAMLLYDRITRPFALPSTACSQSPFARNVALGYDWNGAWGEVRPSSHPEADRSCSAVGLISNAADLLTWLEGLRATRIVSASAFSSMTHSGKLPDGVPTYYASGFFTPDWFGYRVAEHPGYTDGFSSQDALVLEDGLEVAVLTNAQTVDLSPLTESIVAILDPAKDLLTGGVPGAAQNEDRRVSAALQALLQTAGFARYGEFRSLEFIGRAVVRSVTYDRYRVTFSTGQWWAMVGYRANDAIESLSLTPIE
jgi:D-alanyl-D-alanine carboxypeptidase